MKNKRNRYIISIFQPLLLNFRRLYRLAQEYPGLSFATAGVVIAIPFGIYDYYNNITFRELSVNIQSSVFEVFFLGLLVVGYNKLSSRKEAIERYKEEIASYIPWMEPEATYRIVGLIRSLNKLNVTDINLRFAFLPKANFYNIHLEGAKLDDVHLEEARLGGGHFEGASLSGTYLQDASLEEACLKGACLVGAQLQGANLRSAQLQGANLKNAQLQRAWLIRVQLQGANLLNAQLQEAKLIAVFLHDTNLEGVNLEGAIVVNPNWITELKQMRCLGVEYIEKKYEVISQNELGNKVYRIREKKTSGKNNL